MNINLDWNAISAIASAIATIAALVTIILTIKNNKDSDDEKQFAVQPWFHVYSTERMGAKSPIKLFLMNDAASTIRINKMYLKIEGNNTNIELGYRYLKQDSSFVETGKNFEVTIGNEDSYFGKKGQIEVYFTNLYNNEMKATSPTFYFQAKKDENTLLDIESKQFLYIPFINELIK